jgi:hypothetical protein
MIALHAIEASMRLPSYVVPGYDKTFPETIILQEGYETGPVGWTASANAGTPVRSTDYVNTGSGSLTYSSTVVAQFGNISKTFAGFSLGRSYTVSVWVRAQDGITAPIDVQLLTAGYGGVAFPATTAFQKLSLTFTATSPTLTLFYSTRNFGFTGPSSYWDDLTITQNAYTIPVPPVEIPSSSTPITLTPEEATFTLDEEWSPFAIGRLKIANADLAELEAIDPRAATRMTVTLSQSRRSSSTMDDFNAYMIAKYGPAPTMDEFNTEYAGDSMNAFNAEWSYALDPGAPVDSPATYITLDLGIRNRSIDYRTGSVVFELASDEALLQDLRRVSSLPLAPASNTVRDCVNLALDSIGASISGGSLEAPAVTKYINGFELATSTDDWAPGTGVSVSNSGAQAQAGARSLSATFTAVAAPAARMTRTMDFEIGKTHSIQGWFLWTGAGTRSIGFETVIGGSTYNSGYSTLTSGVWKYIGYQLGNVPATTGTVSIIDGTTGVVGGSIFMDTLSLIRSAYSYTPGTANVAAGAALWMPGDTAWDYITPILQTDGLVLWCDETRAWHLAQSNSYSRGATAISDTTNAVEMEYTVDRNDESWFDAAIVVYSWTDSAGASLTAYDTYALPNATKAQRFEYATVYPGAGAAQYLVERAVRRGKAYTAVAVSDYDAYPGDTLTIAQTNRGTKKGHLRSVEWNFPTHEMRVETRGMEDA